MDVKWIFCDTWRVQTIVFGKNEKFVGVEKQKLYAFLFKTSTTKLGNQADCFKRSSRLFYYKNFKKKERKCSLSWAYTKDGLWVQSNLQNADISGIYGNKSGVRLESYLYDKQ